MIEAARLFERLNKHPNTRAVIAEALLAAEKRGEERERERCAGIAHKQVFTAKQWGGKDEMLEGGNRRARVIAYLIRKEPAE